MGGMRKMRVTFTCLYVYVYVYVYVSVEEDGGEEDGGRVTFTCLYESKDFGFEIHGWVNLHEHRRQGLKQQQRTLMIKMR